MGEHLTICVDHLVTPQEVEASQPSAEGSCSCVAEPCSSVIVIEEEGGNDAASEEEPLLSTVECWICHEEDKISNLEAPCACSGTLKFAHRRCVQQWCDEKGDINCEICHQLSDERAYQSGYTAPIPRAHAEDIIHISGAWGIRGAPLDLHDPQILAMTAVECRLLEAEYDASSFNGAELARTAALIVMAVILSMEAHSIKDSHGSSDGNGDDASTFFAFLLLRAVGFLLSCYIVVWAICILLHHRQRQEIAAALAASDAFTAHHQGLQMTIATGTGATPLEPPSTSGTSLVPHQEPIE